MPDNFDVVQRCKDGNPIEVVVEEDGYPLPTRGRYRKCTRTGTGGLVIDTAEQTYHWNGRGEFGDVITWVMRERKLDFKAAVETLARRAGLPEPNWGREDQATRMAARAKEDALDVAQRLFVKWLWRSPEAQMYCLKRGWTDDLKEEDGEVDPGTIRKAMLGYSGEGTDAEREEMRQVLNGGGVDLDSPAAIAILGKRNDVINWAKARSVTLNDDWLLNGKIPGMLGHKRLVYPHVRNGRLRYLSARSIEGKYHYNLPETLVGERLVYCNHVYASSDQVCVVVEGQADAISLAQWGISAVALAGVTAGDELAQLLAHHQALYVGLDADIAGRKNAWRVADPMGPMVRLVGWETGKYPTWVGLSGEAAPVKDANDLLRAMGQAAVAQDGQVQYVKGLLAEAPTYAESMAAWAGEQQGAARDDAVKNVMRVLVKMEPLQLADYRSRIGKAMGVGVRDLDRLLKTMNELVGEEGKPGEVIHTLGGVVDGWLVEYMYDPEKDQARLAWRDPEGKVAAGDHVDINGQRYVGEQAGKFIKDGAVLFSSDLGTLKSTRELVAFVELFIRQSYLLEDRNMAKVMAYYVMLTWVYDSFNALPYLRAMGEPGAGKSELMKRVGFVCYRMMTASGASSASSFFRATEKYQGTVFIDEADLHEGGDMTNDLVKFLNLGAMKGNPIWRTVEVMKPDGSRVFEPDTFRTFCPKLIAMRKEFKDDAVATRCITVKLQPREAFELKAAGVRLHIDEEFRRKALALRNLLLRWRMETWQPEILINEDDIDMEISSRLNQVTIALLAIAKDDPELKAEIRRFLREYYAELTLSKSMTIAARVVEAIWKIYKYPDLRLQMLHTDETGMEYIMIGDVKKIANEIMDEMNSSGDAEDDEEDKKDKRKRKGDELTARGVGSIVRNELQLRVGRRRMSGFPVIWDEIRMTGLAKRYGLDVEQIATEPRTDKKARAAAGNIILGKEPDMVQEALT